VFVTRRPHEEDRQHAFELGAANFFAALAFAQHPFATAETKIGSSVSGAFGRN